MAQQRDHSIGPQTTGEPPKSLTQRLLDSGHGLLKHLDTLFVSGDSSETSQALRVPALREGADLTALFAGIYQRLGPELGASFVEPNVLLTLANLKGQTEFFRTTRSVEHANQLASLLEGFDLGAIAPGCHLRVSRLWEHPDAFEGKDYPTLMMSIENLVAIERCAKLYSAFGLPAFDAKQGLEASREWMRQVAAKFEQQYPHHHSEIVIGLWKGYPYQAAIDFAEWLESGRSFEMASSTIAFSGTYSAAQPNFDFKPCHALDPDIRRNIDEAGGILGAFYRSEYHRTLLTNGDFLAAREEACRTHEESMQTRLSHGKSSPP